MSIKGLKSKRIIGVSQDRNREFIILIISICHTWIQDATGAETPNNLPISGRCAWQSLRLIAGDPSGIPLRLLKIPTCHGMRAGCRY